MFVSICKNIERTRMTFSYLIWCATRILKMSKNTIVAEQVQNILLHFAQNTYCDIFIIFVIDFSKHPAILFKRDLKLKNWQFLHFNLRISTSEKMHLLRLVYCRFPKLFLVLFDIFIFFSRVGMCNNYLPINKMRVFTDKHWKTPKMHFLLLFACGMATWKLEQNCLCRGVFFSGHYKENASQGYSMQYLEHYSTSFVLPLDNLPTVEQNTRSLAKSPFRLRDSTMWYQTHDNLITY